MISEIETPRLILRPISLSDAPAVMEMSQEPLSRKWLSNQVCENITQAEKLIEFLTSEYHNRSRPLKGTLVLGVEHKQAGKLIGHVGISPYKNMMEIGYGIGEAYQQQGYATEAVHSFTVWLLSEGQLQSVFGLVDAKNLSSQRVLIKSGYKLTGVFPGEAYGKKNECHVYNKQKENTD